MKRLLFISHRVPYPPNKGEKVRAYNELKVLAKDYRITLATLAQSRADFTACEHLKSLCEKVIAVASGGKLGLLRGSISMLGGGSVTEGFFHSRRLQMAIHEELERKPFDLAIGYSSSTLGFLLSVPNCRRVLDLVDVDSAKWSAYADSSIWPMRWLYQREANGVRRLEKQALENCDAVLLVSRAEIQAMGFASDKLLAVHNGVDGEYFSPGERPADSPPCLVFTGTMDYRPNVEGICWFIETVWSDIKREVPDLTLNIVGRNPVRAVRRLRRIAGVKVTGAVADVRPYLSAAKLAVVPLLIARGIQNKILEAMAMGRAVVASAPALEGLEVEVGKEVLRADTPAQWRDSIITLLVNNDRRKILEQSARARVVANYSWPKRLVPLLSVCNKLATMNNTLPQT